MEIKLNVMQNNLLCINASVSPGVDSQIGYKALLKFKIDPTAILLMERSSRDVERNPA